MYKTHGKEYCASHYITYDVVYKLVLKDVRRVLKSYRKNKDEFRSFLDSKCSDSSAKKVIQLEHELEKAQGRIAEIDHLLNKLYEDNALGKISEA